MQYWLPPKHMCTHKFLLDIVNNNKKVVNVRVIDFSNIRGADSLSLSKVINDATSEIPSLEDHLLEDPLRHCTKEFLFRLIQVLRPGYISRYVELEE